MNERFIRKLGPALTQGDESENEIFGSDSRTSFADDQGFDVYSAPFGVRTELDWRNHGYHVRPLQRPSAHDATDEEYGHR